jgi:hypothetical protein
VSLGWRPRDRRNWDCGMGPSALAREKGVGQRDWIPQIQLELVNVKRWNVWCGSCGSCGPAQLTAEPVERFAEVRKVHVGRQVGRSGLVKDIHDFVITEGLSASAGIQQYRKTNVDNPTGLTLKLEPNTRSEP